MTVAAEVRARVAGVLERMAAAAGRSGRDQTAVTLVAVTKTRTLDETLWAWEAGVRHFGENRVQEAETKLPFLPDGAVRHLVGALQSNKAARAARLFDVVHSIDSVSLADRLGAAAAQAGRSLEVYVEVNTGDEATKSGVAAAEVPALLDHLRSVPGLTLRGLMAIPPPGETRPHFVLLRRLAEAHGLQGLSMGMSDDFEVAIEEGATLVRVGTALFGPRRTR